MSIDRSRYEKADSTKPQSRTNRDTLLEWVKAVIEDGVGLSPWEDSFANDIEERLLNGYGLSEKQEEILKRLYDNKTP
jgi:hypothetical protein